MGIKGAIWFSKLLNLEELFFSPKYLPLTDRLTEIQRDEVTCLNPRNW